MSKEDNIAKHRLGVAKKYLKKIIDCRTYDDPESIWTLKLLAEEAIREMEKIK